ncbi:MAG: 3-oxoacyl-ACP synthase [Bacteroidota bacterium]
MKKKIVNFKLEVYTLCKQKLEERILSFEQAMKNAQEASNSEDKSSAGDKYETSRAMGQLDRDMNAKQLVEAQSEFASLSKINIDIISDKIIHGSMVETDMGIYFIAAGIGTIELKDETKLIKKVIVLSPKSPLAIALLGKSAGEIITFNQKQFHIKRLV